MSTCHIEFRLRLALSSCFHLPPDDGLGRLLEVVSADLCHREYATGTVPALETGMVPVMEPGLMSGSLQQVYPVPPALPVLRVPRSL
jgi:hypothetical protein